MRVFKCIYQPSPYTWTYYYVSDLHMVQINTFFTPWVIIQWDVDDYDNWDGYIQLTIMMLLDNGYKEIDSCSAEYKLATLLLL